MKIFTDPKVYLISEPKINWSGVGSFFNALDRFGKDSVKEVWTDGSLPAGVSDSTKADLLSEFAGRICYGSFGVKQGRKSNKDYLEHTIGCGHGSILEHANFTFLVTQASRGFTHEMVRHRAGFAYSQESTHYVDYNVEKARVCVDVNTILNTETVELFENQLHGAFTAYDEAYQFFRKEGHKKKVACSMARQLLPIAIEAKLVFTGNVRALRHMMLARGNAHNVLEIRKVALEVFRILEQKCPNSLYGIRAVEADDGFFAIEANDAVKKV